MKKKLQPDHSYWGFLAPIFVVIMFATTFTLFGLNAAFYTMMVIFSVISMYNIFIVVRTGNLSFILVALYTLTTAIFMLVAPTAIDTGNRDLPKLVIVPLMFLGSATGAQFFMKNLKWRGREVFEIAAETVETTTGGYTNRPLPAGETTVSFHKVNSFADFAQRKMIALVVKEPGRILFFPIKENKEMMSLFFLRQQMEKMTYVAFDRDGHATVQISETDYLDFRQDYSFDLLCAALGEFFIELIEDYSNGEEKSIIERMNQVGYGPFE